MKRVLAFACLIAALSVSAGALAAAGAASMTGARTEQLELLDQQVLGAVNQARVSHGLRPLIVSKGLQRAAEAHSSEMLEQGFFAHDTPDGPSFGRRIRSFYPPKGFTTWSAGENLLYSTAAITAAAAVRAWLKSRQHRENMLSPTWREVGIASLRARAAGGTFGGRTTWVVTMDFGVRSGKSPTSSLETSSRATVEPSRSPAVSVAAIPLRRAVLQGKSKRPRSLRGTRGQAVLRFLPGGRVSLLNRRVSSAW
jgi:uncharacterized protein YkwD